MVAMPAVLPYSSTTITMWLFSCCIWRIRSLTGLVSGTSAMVRTSSRTVPCSRSSSSSSNMSRTWTKPIT